MKQKELSECYTTRWKRELVPISKNTLRFAAFEVDSMSGELRKYGLRIKLQDQPFKILEALLAKPGEVVTREELRERIWGNEVFVDFDHGLSAAVNRLRSALGDTAENPRYVETVARRGYRFIGTVERPPVTVTEPVAAPPARKIPWALAALLAVTGIVGIGLWLVFGRTEAPLRLTQVTSLIGSETMPALSPDGEQVAFVWNGEKEDNSDIFVKLVGSETTLRLTSGPGADLLPSWSPDGRQIAFARVHGKTGIYVVSPLGGPERKVMEFAGIDRRTPGPETKIVGDLLYPIVSRPSWSADGKFLAVVRNSEPPEPGDGAVLLVPVNGGEPQTLLAPKAGDKFLSATISPDGQRLAVTKCGAGTPPCEIQIVPLNEGLAAAGAPRTILPYRGQIRGVAWMPDGESLIVGGFELPRFYSWRVFVNKQRAPERIEMAGADAIWPSVSLRGAKFAYGRSILQADLWRLELEGKPEAILSSTARDTSPRFSPDGTRIAFQSARGGENDIWAARADGTGLRQLTKNMGGSSGSPAWSPDGKRIAFDAVRKEGGYGAWIVDAEGGPPRRLSPGAETSWQPNWSPDGKQIYFTSARSGRAEIWRVPVEGGVPEQITRTGGSAGSLSRDGKTLYYVNGFEGQDGIYSQPLAGGEGKLLIAEPIVRVSYDVVPEGIYYITPRDANWCDIRFYDFARRASRVVTKIERPVAFGLSATPDQKTFIYSRPVTGSDLMLIENFR